MTVMQIIALSVFVITMGLIISERIHRATAALLGAVVLMLCGTITFDSAMGYEDFNTLGLLIGMMLFVGVVKESGLFEYLAVKAARAAKGDPWKVMVALVLITALLSALLDNVTTILLVGPVTLTICALLDVNPIPYFIAEMMASNIGGTATLIGDPPNIMIGSAANLDFLDFVRFDTPAVLMVLLVTLVCFRFIYGRRMQVAPENRQKVMDLDPTDCIRDAKLLRRGVVMSVVVVAGFMMHGAIGVESSVVALSAAAIMLLIGGQDLEKVILSVEWSSIGFFAGLFIVVGALQETGLVGMFANWLMGITGGQMVLTMLVVLWASALASSVLDNIPLVATMIPVIAAMQTSGVDVTPLWWALSLGACLGGTGTLIGASANIVLAGISERHGYRITFMSYLKVGFPLMLISIVVCTVYLLVVF